MIIAESIEELVLVNIKLWHEATKIKDMNNHARAGLTSEDRVNCFLKIRELNTKRSKTRSQIDIAFNDGVNESKINYAGDE